MNSSVQKLHHIAQKPSRTIIGLMSGTSLDGLDIALCQITGSGTDTNVELKQFTTVNYELSFKNRLSTITSVAEASMEEVTILHSRLGNYYGELILDALDKWGISPSDIDCIASHGQTIYHAPKSQHGQADMPNATLQIGDGDHIAQSTGILTISDFRQKHTATGGEGAPMAALVDLLLFSDETAERILLNIGGIANFTYLPHQRSIENPITTDTGPGNTLIDKAVQKYFEKDFDIDGTIAQKGSVNKKLLQSLKTHPYFNKKVPKTTGPEVFNLQWVDQKLSEEELTELSPDDLITTLTRFAAETIADSINSVIPEDKSPTIYASGGGVHNPQLTKWLDELLPNSKIESFASIGFDPDAKEAVVFAVLANEMLSGEGFSLSFKSEDTQNFGKISLPD